MKTTKKFVSFFLILCMILSILPCEVLAEDVVDGSTTISEISFPEGTIGCEGDDIPRVAPDEPIECNIDPGQPAAMSDVLYATSEQVGETVRYSVLVLDTSDSSSFEENGWVFYTANTAIDYVKASAKKFVSDVQKADGVNYVAVVEYRGSASNIVSDFTIDYDTLNQTIDGLYSSSTTRSVAYGLQKVNSLLDEITDSDAIKNVVLFTTGMTNEGPYSYSGRYDENTVGSNWRRLDTQVRLYAYANSAIAEAETLKKKATLYTVGLFQVMEDMPQAGREVVEFFKLFAKDTATSEDHFYDVSDPSQLEFVFGEIADDIQQDKNSGKFKYAGQIDQERDQEAIYYYDDGYFFKDATQYDQSLSTMSLCLELSTWSSSSANQTYLNSGEKEDKIYDQWYDPNLSPSDPAFWQDTLVNVKTLLLGNPAAGNGYEGIGFHDFAASTDWQSIPTKDSIGVVAARKQISAGDGEKEYTLVALVVRGGGYGSEWSSNFTLGSSGEHEGFRKAKEDVLDFLSDYVSTLREDEAKDLKLWVVGFSRGGITANMVTGELNQHSSTLLPGTVSLCQEDTYCYVFEPPMGIMDEQDDGSHLNIHNIVNQSDLVPLVAPDAWDFTRYNAAHDWALPSSVSNAKWNEQFSAMKRELEKLGYDPDFYYTIRDSYNLDQFNVDLSSWFPGGDPLWWNESENRSTRDIINDGVTVFLNDFFQGRTYYATNTEYGVRQLIGIGFYYAGILNGVNAYIEEVGGTPFSFEEFMDNFAELLTWDSIKYILKPAVAINFDSPTNRIDKVKDRAKQKVLAVFGGIAGEIAEMNIFVNALGDGLGSLFGEIAGELIDSNTQSLNNIMNFIEILDLGTVIENFVDGLTSGEDKEYPPNQVFCAHYPEICLAWVRSQDPNYNTINEDDPISSITRIIRINCPVDATVYDSNGKPVASIKNNIPQDLDASVLSTVTIEGEKVFYLPGDEEYRVEVSATGDGTVCYSVSEFNFVHNDTTRARYYLEIPVSAGDALTGVVPKIPDDELNMNSETGSSVVYQLFDGANTEILSSSDVVPDTTYKVTVEKRSADGVVSDDEVIGGTVTGAGTFLENDFAKIMAQPLPGSEFHGFTVNGVKVDDITEEIHSGTVWYVTRFRVTSNTTVVAEFEDITLHMLSFDSGVGGTVTNEDGYFGSEMTIYLQAVPNEGYEFVGWTSSNGGSFGNTSDANTSFVMPANDVTVTATFRRTESGSPGGGSITPSDPSYQITTSPTTNGTVTVTPKLAKSGEKVTITVLPDNGYKVDSVAVTDGSGKHVHVTNNGDGTYIFTMPTSQVMVSVTFKWINPFIDVSESNWFYDEVTYVAQNGLMVGTSATTFAPNSTTTRAMIVTILHRLENSPAAGSVSFDDVEAGTWYTEAVAWVAANGIVDGYGNGKFGPNDPITREQMATILYRYADYKGYDVSGVTDLASYTDAEAISDWALTAMRWANDEGLITGRTTTTLVPDGTATRAEVAAILMRFCQNVAGLE